MAAVELDAVVIGGGVVGLAVARALAQSGREVSVLEAESVLGAHTSSRNSEVIHAGIYYAPGSLKARLCLRGRHALYGYCQAESIQHERLGKIIVATTDEQIPKLEALHAQAKLNGVDDLVWLDRADIGHLEPALVAVRGLLSPSTGIIDGHGLMSALRRDTERALGQIVVSTPVLGGVATNRGIELHIGGQEPVSAICRTVINAAGLWAQEVARSIVGVPRDSIPARHLAKGHYFTLNGRSPFSRLVYPVPVAGGLGVHVTLDLSKKARFGPDVVWVDRIDYGFDPTREPLFYQAIRTYFPTLADGGLSPGYVGIRPKLGHPGATARDFEIQGPTAHGVPGLVNLYGIESPGLTASLAIAEHILALLAPRS